MPHSAAGLVGATVQFASAVLLLAVFLLVFRLSSRRQLLRTWIVAWAAQLVAVSGQAVTSITMLGGVPLEASTVTTLLRLVHVPGQFVFLAMISIGALEATGRSVAGRWQVWLAAGAAAVGFALADQSVVADQIQLIAMPLLCFGCAQFVLARATGSRQRGMIALASALVLYGTLATVYLLAGFLRSSDSVLARLVNTVSLTSGFGDAIALTILGGAIIVLVLQDTFLDAAAAREAQMRDLERSRRRLQDIIQAAGEAILTADSGGKIAVMNAAAEQLFLVPSGAATGRDLADLFTEMPVAVGGVLHTVPGASARAPISAALLFVGEGRRTDGSRFPMEGTVARLQGADPAGAVVVVRDLTQRFAAGAQREESERRLAESEKILAVNRVVSSVIHELDHPLAAVLNASDRLLRSAEPGDTHAGLRSISEAAHRARHIIRDLSTFVRTGPNRGDVVDLTAVVRSVAASGAPEAARRGVTFTMALPERVPLASASQASVEQIVRGLVDNALEAAGSGGTVLASVRVVDRQVEVAVEDSGAGVPESLVPHLFEPSFTTKASGKATGLGLSLSVRVAKALGGSLRFENHPAPGIGARFVLAIPMALSDTAPKVPE